MDAEKLAGRIKSVLTLFEKGCFETRVTLVKKKGDPDMLGISDMGENTKAEKYPIKVLLIIRGSDQNAIGEIRNGMELGNNPDAFLEFIRIPSQNQPEIGIETGDEVLFQGAAYTIMDRLPVLLGNEVLLEQFTAERVL